MKKIVIKSLQNFREWQSEVSKNIGGSGQWAVSNMDLPVEYPVILIWSIDEMIDFESQSFDYYDRLQFQYVYIGNFPIRQIKRGRYVYQIFQTSDVCD